MNGIATWNGYYVEVSQFAFDYFHSSQMRRLGEQKVLKMNAEYGELILNREEPSYVLFSNPMMYDLFVCLMRLMV